jgi:hypothetical protein
MAPAGSGEGLSAKRAQFAGPSGIQGIIQNRKTSLIASFAALGGFVYGCEFVAGCSLSMVSKSFDMLEKTC